MLKLKLPNTIYELKPHIYILLAIIIWLGNMTNFGYWILSAILFTMAYRIINIRQKYRHHLNTTTMRNSMDIQISDSNQNYYNIKQDVPKIKNLDLDTFKKSISLVIENGSKKLTVNFNEWYIFGGLVLNVFPYFDTFSINGPVNTRFSKMDGSHILLHITEEDSLVFNTFEFENALERLDSTICSSFSYKCLNEIKIQARLNKAK
jgi:hypothetical protein